METFVTIFPDLTNRPWVSEDEEELGKLINDASQTSEGIYMHLSDDLSDDLSAAIFTFWVYVMSLWIIHSTKAT